MCKKVIEQGVDINSQRDDENTPLHVAAVIGDIAVVQLLVESGAKVSSVNLFKRTALQLARKNHDIDAMKYLLSQGCNVNSVDAKGKTPLIMAASQSGPDASHAVQVLLDHNASIVETDATEKSALFWAAEEDAHSVLKLLLEKIKSKPKLRYLVNQTDRFDNTPLHIASTKGLERIIKLLLSHKARVDACNDEELTPLHLAAIHGNSVSISLLLKKQRNVIDDEDESGK